MKRIRILQGLGGLLALTLSATAQTATGFAPGNFGNIILTNTPSNATGASGVSTVYTSSGSQFTFGTGGNLVNPAQFNYVVTGPNTATLSVPAAGNNPATTTNLVFTNANAGTYTTVSGSNTTTGRFGLAEIPSSAPIENVSARSTVSANGSTTVGFVIAGTMPRRVLIRAVGPGLAAFGVTNALTNPSLTLYRGSQMIARNDDWATLQTVTGTGASSGGSGSASGSTSGGSSLGTGSTGTGSTSGGTSSGTGSTTGTGSTNGFFSGTLSDGSAFTTQLATASDFTAAGAFALTQGSKDAGFVVTLPPGAYTVVVTNSSTVTASAGSSSGGTTGSTSSTGTGSTSGGTSSGTGSTSGGTSSGSTSGGTSSGSTSTGGTSTGTGSTSGGTSSGSTSTGGTSTGTGSTSGGTSSGGTTTGGTSTGTASTGGTGSAATGTTTTGDVLVEVYFIE